MTKDEALKLALEALEKVHQDPKGWWNCHVEITAIQAALARPEQELQESFKLGYDAGVLETQLDQAKERNFCQRCGKRLMNALGPVSLHTCCPPSGRTFDDYGNKIL